MRTIVNSASEDTIRVYEDFMEKNNLLEETAIRVQHLVDVYCKTGTKEDVAAQSEDQNKLGDGIRKMNEMMNATSPFNTAMTAFMKALVSMNQIAKHLEGIHEEYGANYGASSDAVKKLTVCMLC